MKQILVTIANHVYDFEIEVAENGTPNTVSNCIMDYHGYNVVALCNLIYDVTGDMPVKSRYCDGDLTREAITLLLRTSKEISVENLPEAIFKAYPNI